MVLVNVAAVLFFKIAEKEYDDDGHASDILGLGSA